MTSLRIDASATVTIEMSAEPPFFSSGLTRWSNAMLLLSGDQEKLPTVNAPLVSVRVARVATSIPGPDDAYAGCTDGRVFHTRWSGSAWGAVTTLGTPRAGAYVSDLEVNSADQNSMWLTHRLFGGGRVWSSSDGGTNWTDRSAGLPTIPVNAVTVDSANGNRVWVAADLGVYESLPGGASWSTFSSGLPNCLIGDIVFHPHARAVARRHPQSGCLGG